MFKLGIKSYGEIGMSLKSISFTGWSIKRFRAASAWALAISPTRFSIYLLGFLNLVFFYFFYLLEDGGTNLSKSSSEFISIPRLFLASKFLGGYAGSLLCVWDWNTSLPIFFIYLFNQSACVAAISLATTSYTISVVHSSIYITYLAKSYISLTPG